MIDAMQQVKSFIGEFEHRISLLAVREELGCIGPIYEPHGDLIGRRVMVGRGRLWKRSDSSALSFPCLLYTSDAADE